MSQTSGDSTTADVVVVGAGIAGTVVSYLLARSGIDTILVERHRDLSREFRGFGFQPLAVQYFDEMGLLEDVYARDPVRITRPQLHAFGSSYAIADIAAFDEPYDHMLFMEQPPLLELLIERARAHDNFDYRDGMPVTDLLWDDDRVTGIRARDRRTQEAINLEARVVVACDGRYSTIRDLLDWKPNRFDSNIELVWTKLPTASPTDPAEVYLNEHGALANFGLPGATVQLGLVIEAGTYPAIRDRGVERFAEHLGAIGPPFAELLHAHFDGFEQCSILQIAPGITEQWTHDGIVLCGDAAHIASPFGGQGNLMALKDAVAVHPVLVDALSEGDDDAVLAVERLAPFERQRRPTVTQTVELQHRMGRRIGWFARNCDAVPPIAFNLLFKLLFTVGAPVVRHRMRDLLFGRYPPQVATSAFTVNGHKG